MLVETAFVLFVERGFANVSMEEVAQAAGVSRSTTYRRFAAKEDLVLAVPQRWLVVFDETVDALPLDASTRDAISAPVLAVACHIDQHAETVRTAYRILEQSPTLQQSGLLASAWLGRIAAVFERFSTADVETTHVLAGAYFGAIDAMMLRWATAGVVFPAIEQATWLLQLLEPTLPTGSQPGRLAPTPTTPEGPPWLT